MNAIILAVAIGWASQYSPGVMDRVIVNQQRYGHLPASLPDVDGYVAVLECNRMGEVVYIQPEGGHVEKFLVADCAGDISTRSWMKRNNILAEVDYRTAVRWNTVGRGKRISVVACASEGSVRDLNPCPQESFLLMAAFPRYSHSSRGLSSPHINHCPN